MTGVWRLTRLHVRSSWPLLVGPALLLAGLVVATARGVKSLYPSAAEKVVYAATMGHLQKAAGFISTHDIELGDMANEGQFAHNYSFYSTFTEGKLHFDYQLKEGVCREFNATALMRQIGIEIP